MIVVLVIRFWDGIGIWGSIIIITLWGHAGDDVGKMVCGIQGLCGWNYYWVGWGIEVGFGSIGGTGERSGDE